MCEPLWIEKQDVLPPLLFSGFASVPSEVPVGTIHEEIDFVVQRGQELQTVAACVSAGVQPTGRSMPQLLPDGLGPKDHLKVALATTHPFARPRSVPVHCANAINAQAVAGESLVARRYLILDLVRKLAKECLADSEPICSLVNPWIRPVVQGVMSLL